LQAPCLLSASFRGKAVSKVSCRHPSNPHLLPRGRAGCKEQTVSHVCSIRILKEAAPEPWGPGKPWGLPAFQS
ncbi:mCG145991, partial [Mus musculus]